MSIYGTPVTGVSGVGNTLDDFLADFRSQVNDDVVPLGWSNTEFISYFNKCRNEFAKKSRYYSDHITDEICKITVTADVSDYQYDSRILDINRVLGSWSDIPLRRRTVKHMDVRHPSWLADSASDPVRYIIGRTYGYLTLHPIPATSGYLYLDVTRLPLSQMLVSDIGSYKDIDFPIVWNDNLMDGIKSLAYAKPDSQTRNPDKEKYYKTLWRAFLDDSFNSVDDERSNQAWKDSMDSYEDEY